MHRFRSLAYALLALSPLAAPFAAKSPEEFVGPAPGPAPKTASVQQPGQAAGIAPKAVPNAPARAPAPDSAGRPASAVAPAKPASAKAAARASVPKPAIDTARVHALYLDGDFDQAIRHLETALKGRRPLSHGDSVFAFKHLGVMYAATPATREKGRYYMLQLISIEPTAKILDMYASDMIYLIFRNVQEEYESKRGKAIGAAPAADTVAATTAAPRKDSLPAPAPIAATPSRDRKRTLYWVAGGAAVAAGAMGLVFILLDDPQPKKRNIVLPE